ncbi:DUF4453 domain-containing protein [Leisingera sp. HS039]|uniref:DUF4453 domain-containing protein n=1 Tax=unclassified Leisingera TaxID=2614906 RepID=UPI0010712359|nr:MULTISPECIES: DUF4453 domain-containing protein [unclassified Leisingera]MBQ4824160.1 DUF4453 domain-containing protein [Leisingera sp. HS039]MCF6430438.1 DUF4453 domain-containing protein [Leisingera sp. MMG026]QBR36879.1 DUF4453 domain-containing protein [Leisingera sp. NJS201]
MKSFAAALCLLASPVLASDACHDLWFTRNAVIDRAGYCFGSPLGRAVFDNGDCIGKSVSLPPHAGRMVALVKEMEARFGCRVNNKQTYLDLDDLFLRHQLWDLPVRDEFESACLGWLGPVTGLRAGHRPDAPLVGQIVAGDYVSYSHIPVGSWTYVTTSGPDWQATSGGWLDTSLVQEQCREVAG